MQGLRNLIYSRCREAGPNDAGTLRELARLAELSPHLLADLGFVCRRHGTGTRWRNPFWQIDMTAAHRVAVSRLDGGLPSTDGAAARLQATAARHA